MKQILTAHDVSALVSEYSKQISVVSVEQNVLENDSNLTVSELEPLESPEPLNQFDQFEQIEQSAKDIVTCSGGLVGMYLENIYDIDKKTLVLKLKFKSARKYLLIESGQRMHTIERFDASGSGAPKSFCVKIRKHIRERRIVSIKQINHDRVVDIQFGTDETDPYHIILEFYASGNIILTDKNYLILDLVHYHCYDVESNDQSNTHSNAQSQNHEDKEKQELTIVRPGRLYPFDKACAKESDHDIDTKMVKLWFDDLVNSQAKKKIKDCVITSPFKNYPTVLIEHCFTLQGLSVKQKIGKNEQIQFDEDAFATELKKTLHIFDTDVSDPRKINTVRDTGFYPYEYGQIVTNSASQKEIKIYSSFDMAVREWFAKIKGDTENRSVAIKKKDTYSVHKKGKKNDVEKRDDIIGSIKSKISELHNKKNHITEIVRCCEENSLYIGVILDHIVTMHTNGYRIDKNEIIERFSNSDLPIKDVVCKGAEKTITFLKTDEEKSFDIVLDWTININKNIRNIYGDTKQINGKMIKTESVIKTIEKKIIKERKIDNTAKVVINRKQLWFEKYNWFLSSDGFLVVSGKDIKSNEYIVKNIMKSHDLYVHSEQPGSGSCVIINPNKLTPSEIGNRTKEEAGLFVVAHTKAWNANIPNEAFWVLGDQVSKTPESGEFLVPGSFIVRGKRNIVLPQNFVMGICVIFWNGVQLTKIRCSDTKFAIVSCAPYTAVLECTYKKKTIPGTGKINKTIECVTKAFHHTADSNDEKQGEVTDKDMIKNIPINDWHRICPGKVKVL